MILGAVGDGVADDTSVIQRVINYAAQNNLQVYFAPGSYVITSGLTIPSNTNILGVNARIVSKDISNTADYVLQLEGVSFVRIEGVAFEGNALSHAATTQHGVYMNNCTDIVISECRIGQVGKSGVYGIGNNNILLKDLVLHDTQKEYLHNTNYSQGGAVRLFGGENIKYIRLEVTGECYGKGLVSDDTEGLVMRDCIVRATHAPAGDAIYQNGTFKSVIDGCLVQNPAGNAIKLSRRTSHCRVTNSTFYQSNFVGSAFRIQGGTYNTVANCNIISLGAGHTAMSVTYHPDTQEGGPLIGNTFTNCKIQSAGAGMKLTGTSLTEEYGQCKDNLFNNWLV